MLISRFTRCFRGWEAVLLTFGATTDLLAMMANRGIVALPMQLSCLRVGPSSIWYTSGMDKYLIFGVAALIVNIVGYVPYIRGIFSGKVKPQRVTWGLWAILTTIAFINQVLNHGGYSSLFFGSTVFLVITVFALSIRKGIGRATKFDLAVLSGAALLFVAWIVSRDTRSSTLIAVFIDGLAAFPTFIKAYRAPHTEAYLQWILAAVSGLLSMLAVTRADYILYVYPLYVLGMNAAIVLAKFFGERRALVLKNLRRPAGTIPTNIHGAKNHGKRHN